MRRTYSLAPVAAAIMAAGCGVSAQDAAKRDVKSAATAKSTPATRVAAPATRAAVRVVDFPAAGVADQMEQRFAPAFRQMYRAELYLMRSVCEPTKPQADKVAADGEAGMKAALKAFAAGANRGETPDPRVKIAEAVAAAVRANLPPDRAARYDAEVAARTEARKRAAVAALVVMTDRVLVLSADQREKLAAVLRDNWDESWNLQQTLMYGDRYFPRMPVAKIDPLLTDAQRAVWKDVPKGTVRFGTSLLLEQFAGGGDDEWDDAPEKAAPAAPKGGKP